MSKQYSAKVMFDQSIVYLFNSYMEQGMSVQEASLNVTKDIDDVFQKHLARGQIVQKSSNILNNPVSKIEKVINTLKPENRESIEGKRPSEIQSYYEGILRTTRMELTQIKSALEKQEERHVKSDSSRKA